MSDSKALYQSLAETLEHESRHLAQLIDLLKEERSDLMAATGERINTIAAEKLNRIQALDSYSLRRNEVLAKLGFPQSIEGISGAIAKAAQAARPRLQALWASVSDRAIVARDLNELNGSLIRARLSSVQGRLAQLQRAAGSGDSLYGADGMSQSPALSRPLGNV